MRAMKLFKVTHPWNRTGNTVLMVYDTCLVMKIFTIGLPAECVNLLVHFLLKIFLLMLFMMLMVDCFGEAIISSESPLGLCSSWHHNLSPDWLCTMLPCCPRRVSSVCGAASASWSRARHWPGPAWCPQRTLSSPNTHRSHLATH